jgi:hypothetical protein
MKDNPMADAKTKTPRTDTTESGPAQPEKLDLRSHDIAVDKRQELLRLFVSVRALVPARRSC